MADIRAPLPRHVGCCPPIGRLESRVVQLAVSLVGVRWAQQIRALLVLSLPLIMWGERGEGSADWKGCCSIVLLARDPSSLTFYWVLGIFYSDLLLSWRVYHFIFICQSFLCAMNNLSNHFFINLNINALGVGCLIGHEFGRWMLYLIWRFVSLNI